MDMNRRTIIRLAGGGGALALPTLALASPDRDLADGPWDDISISVLRGAGTSLSNLREAIIANSLKSTHVSSARQMLGVAFDHLNERGFVQAVDRKLVPKSRSLRTLQSTAPVLSSLDASAKIMGITIDPLWQSLFLKSLSGTDQVYAAAANSLEQRGMSGSLSDFLSLLDKLTGSLQKREKAALGGSNALLQVGAITTVGEVVGAIGTVVASAATIAILAGVTGAVVTAVAIGGALLAITGAVDFLIGLYVDANPQALVDLMA